MHMANGKQATIQLDNEAILSLQKDLALFSRAADSLRKKLSRILPAKYGSDAWWEKEEEKVYAALAQGEYKDFSSVDEMLKYLNVS